MSELGSLEKLRDWASLDDLFSSELEKRVFEDLDPESVFQMMKKFKEEAESELAAMDAAMKEQLKCAEEELNRIMGLGMAELEKFTTYGNAHFEKTSHFKKATQTVATRMKLNHLYVVCSQVFRSKFSGPRAIITNKNAVSLSAPTNEYDLFINHCGMDVKNSIASLVFYNLQNKGQRVFLDKNSIQVGVDIDDSIEQAIDYSLVHLVNFSPNYAQSEWCLKELYLISKTGAPIIPLFYEVDPSEVRMECEDGAYARAFEMHKISGKFRSRTLKQWNKALCKVSNMKGIIFAGDQDQGELLERIAACVSECMERRNAATARRPHR